MKREHLPLDLLKKVVKESNLLKRTSWVIQGGEIGEHPQAAQIAEFLHLNGHFVTLLTNAIHIPSSIRMLPFVDAITISFDGRRHDIVRGAPGNTESIFEYIKQVREKAINPVDLTLQMTLGPWNTNLDEVIYVKELADEHHVGLRINVASDTGVLGNGNYTQNIEKLAKIEVYFESEGENFTARYLREYVKHLKGERLPCVSTSIYSTILQDGRVLLCQGLDTEEATIGNLHDNRFDDIWNWAMDTRKELRTCNKCGLSCQLMGDIKFDETFYAPES